MGKEKRGSCIDDKKLQIRNSTVDFLVFTKQNSEDSIVTKAVSRTTDNLGLCFLR